MNDPDEAGASSRCAGLGRVTDLGLAELTRTWGRSPRHVRGARLPAPFDDLLSEQDVDDLLSRRGLRAPFLRVARDGRTLPDREFTRGGGVGAAIGDQLDDTALLRLFGEGHTLVLQGLHRTHPPLVDLAQDLAQDLGHPVQINAYITPAESRGFSAHYDVHDVFVLQTVGEKRWRVHPPVHPHPLRDQPWQDRAEDVARAAVYEPELEVTLRPGDSLYVPRGWLHAATALGEVSTHLTVGVHTWHRGHLAEELVGEAVRRLAASEEQRSPLRPGVDVADPEDIAGALAATRAALLEAVAGIEDEVVAAALARRRRGAGRPAPVDPVATVRRADTLARRPLLPRPHVYPDVEVATDGTAVLVSRAGRLRLTADEAREVRRWLAGDSVQLDPALARRLLLGGVGVLADRDQP